MATRLTRLDGMAWAGFALFAMSNVITALCLPEIARDLSTDLAQGGGLEAARTLLIALIMLPAGMLGRRWGKKRFITSGKYLLAVGFLLASFAPSYPVLVLSLMVAGIGAGFLEALLNPLVTDIHPEDPGRHLNMANAFYPAGVMIAALAFGELLTLDYSWRAVFRLGAGIALVVALFFHSARFPAPAANEESSWKVIPRILRLHGFWLFAAAIFLGAGVEAAFTFWTRSYVTLYLEAIPRAGSIAVVLFAAAMALGRLAAAWLAKHTSLKVIMMASAWLGIAVSTAILRADSLIAFYALAALAGIAAACFWPTILAEAAHCLDVDNTLLFVMLGCSGIAGFGATPWLMGYIGDLTELRTGFMVVPAIFLVLVIVLAVEWRMGSRALGSSGRNGRHGQE